MGRRSRPTRAPQKLMRRSMRARHKQGRNRAGHRASETARELHVVSRACDLMLQNIMIMFAGKHRQAGRCYCQGGR